MPYLLILLVALLLLPPPSHAQVLPFPSPMQREWLEHLNEPWDPSPPVPALYRPRSSNAENNPIIIMGYLPYWNVGKPTLLLRFDILDVLAYFGASLSSDGTISEVHHWGGPALAEIINQAHSSGVLVVLTVTNFTPSSIAALLSSPAATSEAISNIVQTVVAGGGDGVNIDFEGLPKANKADFVAFISNLKKAMDQALGRPSHVSIATPAVDWSGAYDYDLLAEASDGLFIMGYDYHWSGGNPGPVSPLNSSTLWGKYSLSWTIDDYFTWGGTQNRHKFILGLPLYGFDWPSEGPEVPGKATDKGKARFYARCQEDFAHLGHLWDEASSTPYVVYQDSSWHQLWCEDRQSLALKYALAVAKDLGGIGFWALGYEEGLSEVWEELLEALPSPLPSFEKEENALEGHDENPEGTQVFEEALQEEAADAANPPDIPVDETPLRPDSTLKDYFTSEGAPDCPCAPCQCPNRSSSGCSLGPGLQTRFPFGILAIPLVYLIIGRRRERHIR